MTRVALTVNGSAREADVEPRLLLAYFLRDETHEVDHVFRVAPKPGSKFRILRRDTHRTSIQMADTHHETAQTDERCRRKTSPTR